MINIKNLTNADIGRFVIYTDEKRGKIKNWNTTYIFVVYNCSNEWDNYKNYTAAATCPADLKFEEITNGLL